jgi:hypothetical protein
MTQEIKLKSRFTPYILALKKESSLPHELLKAIGDALYFEMKKRGLWDNSPSWLGYGGERWQKDSDEFNQLVERFCYKSIFTRLNSLQARVKKGQNIDIFVIKNIGYDLSRVQRSYDPIGYAVYENLSFAIMRLVDVGIIKLCHHLKNWKTKIHQYELLAFASCHPIIIADEKSMSEAIKKSFFADIRFLIKLAKKDKQLEKPLCEKICQLRQSNINGFQFYSLIEPVKKEVRSLTDNRRTSYQIDNNEINRDDKDREINSDDEETEPDELKGIGQQLEDSEINPDDEETEPDEQEMASEEEFVMLSEPDKIYLDDFCDEIRAAIKNLKKYRLRRKRFYAILKIRQEAIEQQITPLSLEELARRLGVFVNIEERKPEEWARRLGVSIDEFKQAQQQTQLLEEQAACLGISAGKLNEVIKKPFSTEEIANILDVPIEELQKAIEQNVELPSQEKLRKLLKCSIGTINADMKILRDLAERVKKERDWGEATLYLVAKMLQ